MKVLNIAILCHRINSAYSRSIGEDETGILPWEDMPENVRNGTISAVEAYLSNPTTTPEQLHALWSESRIKDGWVYGEVKDFGAQTHPCLVPYDELPQSQRVKDYLFKEVIESSKHLPDQENYLAIEGELIKLRQENLELKNGLRNTQPTFEESKVKAGTTIVYVGNKSMYTDHVHGSGLTFTTGQVRTIPSDIAKKLLGHPEFKLFSSGDSGEVTPHEDTAEQVERNEQLQREERDREERYFEELTQVSQMGKRELVEYARSRYDHKLSERDTRDTLVAAVTQLIDQFGVV